MNATARATGKKLRIAIVNATARANSRDPGPAPGNARAAVVGRHPEIRPWSHSNNKTAAADVSVKSIDDEPRESTIGQV